MQHRILLASPVRQKEHVLVQFLESLNLLDSTGVDLDFTFVDDHNEHDLLNRYSSEKSNVRIFPGSPEGSYVCDEITHYWQENLIWKIAAYKDQFIKLALEEGYDYLFLIDSDLYVQPQTLKHLIALQKDIVSEVFWTRWQPNTIPLPQVWVTGHYQMYSAPRGETINQEEINKSTTEFLQMLSVPGTYKVGMLGACTLISRKALSLGVSFSQIYNLELWGEDRHFCIRAAALNLELYADTHYPPYHIYRESELEGLKEYKKQLGINVEPLDIETTVSLDPKSAIKGSRITLAMLVRNEASRYLESVLKQASLYIDEAVILDDASEDNTIEICKTALKGIALTIVSNPETGFNNEIVLRKQLWEIVIATKPDWILILDADEVFEDKASEVLKELAKVQEVDHYSFRLYDMWKENSYREDTYWRAHTVYRPFMVRYVADCNWVWRETPQHCGRLPLNIYQLPGALSQLRLKHLGWMKEEDRLFKYNRYKQLDPDAVYGIAEQYESILDPQPNLILWEE
ncbi:MAG TPA: glycosyltransferase [Desulfosporosinus sp.]